MEPLEKNRLAFSGQSQGFSSEGHTYADDDELAWMLADLPLSAELDVLDIATGTGEFARAVAPHVATVTGIDATDAMLEKGEDFARQHGISNITFQNGIVEDLPFANDTFDVVTSRYAFHHFADPKPVLAEMARVCKKGGHILIVDIVVPELEMAADYNYYEWLCDQSHTRCLDYDEFQAYFRLFGLEVISARSREYEEPLVAWMDFSLTEDRHREAILLALREELKGSTKTGMAPVERDSLLYFRQRDAAIVGRKG
jgi:ubiquinone/menaquinone biosynthesis C-methylase UbiE